MLLPPKPSQVLRFEAGFLKVEVTDANHDGRPDLAPRKFELPTLLETVTGLEFRMTHLLYLGQRKGRPFERKPALKQVETFDETGRFIFTLLSCPSNDSCCGVPSTTSLS